ncbi:MAG TPA: hypothetical protein VMV07_05445 [Streptosporangiaceae bacterium]|nr:hypothetical protein [Streptosporangiaceae bacterium]
MLTRLLRSFLRPYTRQVAIVVILLVAQTVGNLGFIVVTDGGPRLPRRGS